MLTDFKILMMDDFYFFIPAGIKKESHVIILKLSSANLNTDFMRIKFGTETL